MSGPSSFAVSEEISPLAAAAAPFALPPSWLFQSSNFRFFASAENLRYLSGFVMSSSRLPASSESKTLPWFSSAFISSGVTLHFTATPSSGMPRTTALLSVPEPSETNLPPASEAEPSPESRPFTPYSPIFGTSFAAVERSKSVSANFTSCEGNSAPEISARPPSSSTARPLELQPPSGVFSTAPSITTATPFTEALASASKCFESSMRSAPLSTATAP